MSNVKFKLRYLLFLFCLYLVYLLIKDFKNSLLFNHPDRVNIFFYGKDAKYYSIGLDDNVNYAINFPSDLQILVPGGYGKYRLGGLGKLVDLEKKPDIFRKTISLNTSSFAYYYFYPSKTEIYFDDRKETEFILSRLFVFFLERSNANLFDRTYLYFLIAGKSKYSFKEIKDLTRYQSKDSLLFSSFDFFKDFQGYFYHSSYRKENSTVQIKYTKSYKTAQFLSRILEGEGIVVVDIAQINTNNNKCHVISSNKIFSQTAYDLSKFFGCALISGKTDFSDIILQLGDKEREWEID